MLKPTRACIFVACVLAGGGLGRVTGALAAGADGPVLAGRSPRGNGAFWAWCWDAPSARDRHLVPMVWVTPRAVPPGVLRANFGVSRPGQTWVVSQAAPRAAAAASRKLPRGRVALFMSGAGQSLFKDPLDMCRTAAGEVTHFPSPWLKAGATRVACQIARFFRQYKADGGRLDFLVLDFENTMEYDEVSRAQVRAIGKDPRSAGLERRLGFSDLASIFRAGKDRRVWVEVMRQRVDNALRRAYFQPARSVFPGLHGSNYGDHIQGGNGEALTPVPNINGRYQPQLAHFGNVQSPPMYGKINLAAWKPIHGRAYRLSPFGVLRWHIMQLQAFHRASKMPIVPWVSYASYHAGDVPYPVFQNRYYEELIYQLALRGVDQFLYWNPGPFGGHRGTSPRDNQVLDHCLAVLNAKFGPKPGRMLHTGPIRWTSKILVAARMTSSRTVLYRVTVAPGITEIVEEPTGRRVSTRGRAGFWVSAAAGRPLRFRLPAVRPSADR